MLFMLTKYIEHDVNCEILKLFKIIVKNIYTKSIKNYTLK